MPDPQINVIDTAEMTELIRSIINIQVCRQYELLPIRKLEQEPPAIVIGMVNPDDRSALDMVEKLLDSKKLKCNGGGYKGRVGVYEFMVITEESIFSVRSPS